MMKMKIYIFRQKRKNIIDENQNFVVSKHFIQGKAACVTKKGHHGNIINLHGFALHRSPFYMFHKSCTQCSGTRKANFINYYLHGFTDYIGHPVINTSCTLHPLMIHQALYITLIAPKANEERIRVSVNGDDYPAILHCRQFHVYITFYHS